MKLTFGEWLEEDKLLESLNRNNNYKRLNKSEVDKIFMKYYNTEDVEYIHGIYQLLPFLKGYTFKMKDVNILYIHLL